MTTSTRTNLMEYAEMVKRAIDEKATECVAYIIERNTKEEREND